jgi:hypothetical protein
MTHNRAPLCMRPSYSSGSNSEAAELLDIESLPLRNLLCALIHQAAEDLHAKTYYLAASKNDANRLARKTARAFFESRAYSGICGILGVSPSRLRAAARRRPPGI